MEAIKCDICGKLEEGKGFSISMHKNLENGFHSNKVEVEDICSDCYARIALMIENLKAGPADY